MPVYNRIKNISIVDPNDPSRKVEVTASGEIKINGLTFSGSNLQVSVENQPTIDVNSIPDIILRDGTNASNKAKVDQSGNIYTVTPAPETPAGKTQLSDTQQSTITGTSDSYTVIPNGETVTIQRLKAGSEMDSVAGSKVELYYAPNGNTTGIVLLDAIYCNGDSDHADLNASYIGDGTRAILLRRARLGGGGIEIFAKWEGYY